MVRTVQLDEDKHSVSMMRSLKQMWQEDEHCDFTIKAQKLQYHVHKCIISAGSPYFKAMLKHDTKERREGKVEMKDVDSESVKSCINFLYSGAFDIPDEKIGNLLHVALIFQLDNVKDAIHDILDEFLDIKNFYETRGIAERYNLQTLLSKCKMFYEENLMTISMQTGFTREKKSRLISILKSKNLKLTEEDKLKVSLRWVGENSGKKQNLFEFINFIKLKEISLEYLGDLLVNHPFVSNDFRLYKLINEPLVESAKKGSQSSSARAEAVHEKAVATSNADERMLIMFDAERDLLFAHDKEADTMKQFHGQSFKSEGHCYTAVSKDPFIYLLYGHKIVRRLNYREKSSKWKVMRPMICDHGRTPPSVSLSGSFFVIGSSSRPTRDVEKYDPDADLWTKLNDKPEAICEAATVSMGDSIYCIGGWTANTYVTTSSKFTPATSEWDEFQPLRINRRKCSAAATEQKIVVMGGYRNNEPVPEVECYDMTSGQWTFVSPSIEAPGHCHLHHLDGWIFCIVVHRNCQTTVAKYDIANDKWSVSGFESWRFYNIYNSVTVPV